MTPVLAITPIRAVAAEHSSQQGEAAARMGVVARTGNGALALTSDPGRPRHRRAGDLSAPRGSRTSIPPREILNDSGTEERSSQGSSLPARLRALRLANFAQK